MLIREMSREECLRVLARARFVRLACAHENQPYVVPVYLAYDEASGCLYGCTTLGLKVEWIRANPLVCVEADEVSGYNQWVSVIAMGRCKELPEPPGSAVARLRVPERARMARERAPAWSADSPDPLCEDGWGDERDEGVENERERAWQVLKSHPMWWEPGFSAWAARPHRDPALPLSLIYYKIRIDHVTGHEATPDAREAAAQSAEPPPPVGRGGWLHRTLARLFGGKSKEAGPAS